MIRIHLVTTAGPVDGMGHLARSVAMTEALVASGARVSVEILQGRPSARQQDRFLALGVELAARDDAVAVLADLPDPNAVGDRWPSDRLLVFDDREGFTGSAAVVIQPSLPRWGGRAHAARVLAGYAYAPIRSSLRAVAGAGVEPVADPGEVVVCFGGSDPADVTARLAPAWTAIGSWRTTIVVGPEYRGGLSDGDDGHGADAALEPEKPGAVVVVRDPPDLDRLLARATLVVSGAGTMKFEVALLGRPMALLAVADDQLPIGRPFAETGAARYLGDGRTIEPMTVRGAVSALMARPADRATMATRASSLVDGRGADRVAASVLDVATAAGERQRAGP